MRGCRGREAAGSLVLGLVLVAAACSPTPVPSFIPSGTPGPTIPSASSTPITSPTTSALAELLRDAVETDRILEDLRTLEAIARANGGTRDAGSPGAAASEAFVVEQLSAAGFDVVQLELEVSRFIQTGPGAIEIDAPHAPIFEGGVDFKPMLFSPSGDVTARVTELGFDPAAEPSSTAGLGCDAADWAGFPRGTIALLQQAGCRTRTIVDHAQAAGAIAVVRSTPAWPAGGVLRPTLLDPSGLTIPVLGATHAVGLALNEAADEGYEVRIVAETRIVPSTGRTIVAETAAGDPGRVVMLGGHLDSVVDGPGINDNGSGSMTVLEIARRIAALTAEPGGAPSAKVRVAFWAAEEIGLWGSFDYVAGLGSDDQSAMVAYLNFDMLGSVNGVRQIYQGGESGDAVAARVEALFVDAFELEGLTWATTSAGGSDDLPFLQAGISVGGLFSGHNMPKTVDQLAAFGGTVGAPLDPCYHLACDTVDNIDPELLGQMARAAAWVVGSLASGSGG